MAVFGCIGLCLPVLFACIVSMSIVQGRNLRRRHNHHSHPDYYLDFEESIPRDLSRRFEDDLEYQQDLYRRPMEKRELSRILDPVEYEERTPLPHRKHINYAESLRKNEARKQEDVIEDALTTRFNVRRKRQHNKHSGTVSYQKFSDQDKQELEISKRRRQQLELYTSTISGLRAPFELEVKEVQNSSICNYTVKSIPIPYNRTRVPKDLEHVRCNYAGSSCQDTGNYCCIQTYRYIEVSYDNGEDREKMKIYVGCVCALQDLNNDLLSQSYLPIHD
ncbi:hypothetical protein EAG_12584 [Camponotus floridanus]|uniref:Spaetzle domain-containing protein n=1 Tax=Camponotus floridanus TaxID=104421 RepID=E2AJB4_CAMFO|nr:hypothetical protein EAG_12584 [Camponotus floridanus]